MAENSSRQVRKGPPPQSQGRGRRQKEEYEVIQPSFDEKPERRGGGGRDYGHAYESYEEKKSSGQGRGQGRGRGRGRGGEQHDNRDRDRDRGRIGEYNDGYQQKKRANNYDPNYYNK